MQKWLGPRGEGYVVLQFVLFGLIALAPEKLVAATWPAPVDIIGRILGGILLLYGIAMLGIGLINLGRNLAAVPHPKDGATLVTNGAYAIVRHPIYSGIILGWIGWGLFNNAELTVLLAALLLPFFDWKTRREERMLAAMFPDYRAYQQRVRKLIPLLY